MKLYTDEWTGTQTIQMAAWARRLFAALFVLVMPVVATSCADGGTGESSRGFSQALTDASDDFSTGTLDAGWLFQDPVGNSSYQLVGSGTADARLAITVPAGSSHDPYGQNQAARLTRANDGNGDFEVEAKFDSVPSQQYQLQGIVAQQDDNDFVRFDFYSDGSNVRFFAARFVAGSAQHYSNNVVSIAPGHRLRVNRTGNTWTASWSPNGSTWTQLVSFNHAMTVDRVGVMAGNDGPNPGFTALVDYFFDTSDPISPEDPAGPPPPCEGPFTLDVNVTGSGTVALSPDQPSYDCDEEVTLQATPGAGHTFEGYSGDASGTNPTLVVTMESDLVINATFAEIPPPPEPSELFSDDFSGGALASGWTFEDPVGDSGFQLMGTGTSDARLALAVGAGHEHDPYGVNNSVRMVQTISDGDFAVEAKFDSVPTQQYQLHGIVAELDHNDFVRFDFYSDGSNTRFFAARFVGGSAQNYTNNVVSIAPGHRLRVNRTGNTWTASFSPNGSTWTQLVSFNHAMTVERVGVMAGNAGPSPAYTGLVDYFFETNAPISPEDPVGPPPPCDGPFTLDVNVVGSGTVALSPDQPSYDCDEQVTLQATPSAGHTFEGYGGDASGTNPTLVVTMDSDLAIDATFAEIPPPPEPSDLVSDDFSAGALASEWTFEDPVGDSGFQLVGTGTSDARLALAVAAGTAHDPYGGNDSVRMVQTITDQDFEVEAKFDSLPSQAYQLHGIVAEQDHDDFVRFDFYSDGSNIRFFAARFVGGSAQNYTNSVVSSIGPGHRLRVNRTGSTWTASWSQNGSTWTQLVSFNHAMTVDRVGAMAGNAGSSPAYTALVDYFFETSAPISPEDAPACDPGEQFTVSATAQGPGVVTLSPNQGTYGCGEVVTLTAQPNGGATFLGWSGAVTGTTTPVNLTVYANSTVTGTFDLDEPPPQGGPAIDVWYGDVQSFGALGNPQQWVNVLGQVTDPDGISSLSYRLNGGPSLPLTVGPFKRLSQPGDFNVELDYQDLLPGENTIEITAVDGVGAASVKLVTVDYSAGNVWPLPYEIDWSTAAEINDVAQIVDGRWSIVDGALRNDLYAYDRIVVIGDLSWTDYEITVPVTVHSISAAGFGGENGAPGVGVMLRWPGHYDWTGDQPNWGYYPIGGGAWVTFETNGIGEIRLEDFTPGGIYREDVSTPFVQGVTYIWKIRAETQPGGTSLYRLKWWPAGDPEPGTWTLSDSEVTDVAAGGLMLIAHFADVTFGDVSITPL